MQQAQLPEFRQQMLDWHSDLEKLRQNKLLDETSLIRFCRERGILVSGVATGDPGLFHSRGWLTSDGQDYRGQPVFHPFRLYPIRQILVGCKLSISATASLDPSRLQASIDYAKRERPTDDQIGASAEQRNRVVDLAILLEPIYWPRITGHVTWPSEMSLEENKALREQYRVRALELVKTLDPIVWRDVHTSLRIDAAQLDNNGRVYALLRLSRWNQREWLTGQISGALWLRHMAEVIRRGFEEAYAVEWLEEDNGFGVWHPDGRERSFGSLRPLDSEHESRPYVAFDFGLLTGSAVRWYVEGETEYHAILHVLPKPALAHIEVVNLRGNIAGEKDNAAMKLRDWMKEDQAQRRFSMITFDKDVKPNVRAVQRQVRENNIVGFIGANDPDFEFANFTAEELAEVAARIDEKYGTSGDPVRQTDWTSVKSGRDFETMYKAVSARKPRGLKGEEWGQALAAFANEFPNRPDTGDVRPFWQSIQAALRGQIAHYDLQREMFGFDPETFEQVRLPPASPELSESSDAPGT